MSEGLLRRLVAISGTVVAGVAALAWRWSVPDALGVLAGGAWNLLNLWCLASALTTWLEASPSRRWAIGWFVVKFPLLYAALVGVLSRPEISPVGFGLGFTVVLGVAAILTAISARQSGAMSPHGS